MIHSRHTWFAFAVSAGAALTLTSAATLLLALRQAKLLETAILMFVVGALSWWWAVMLAFSADQSEPLTVGQTRAGAGLAATVTAVVSLAPDPNRLGRLQLTVLGAAALLVIATVLSPWLVRRGYGDRLLHLLGRRSLPAPVTLTGEDRDRRELLWGLVIVAVAALAFFWLVTGGPLGHDESTYALKARAWREGTPTTGYGVHRPVGMAGVAWVVLGFADAEGGLRMLAAAVSVLTIVLVWRAGRALLSPGAALLAAALLVEAPSFLRRAAEFLNDIATTALVVLIIYLLWRHFEERATNRWEVVLVAPLAAAAFYLRYGVVSTYLVVLLVGGVVWRKKIAASIGPLLITAAGLVLLIVPHVVYAIGTTGSPVGILTAATSTAGRAYFGEGLVTYVRWLPIELAGPLLGPVVAVGALATIAALVGRNKGESRRRRTILLLGGIGAGHLALTGLFVHAEQRYVFLSIALLGLVGAQAILDGGARLEATMRRTTGIAALALLLLLTAVDVTRAHTNLRDVAADRVVIEDAGEAIAEAADADCLVMTSYLPQVTWYSSCATTAFDLESVPRPLVEGLAITDFLLFFDNGKRQPEGRVLEGYLNDIPEQLVVTIDDAGAVGDAHIHRVEGKTGDG